MSEYVQGFVTYTSPTFVAPSSGLMVVREYLQFDWNLSFSTLASPSTFHRECSAYSTIEYTTELFNPSLNLLVGSATAIFAPTVSGCNSTGTIRGPGNVSIPIVVALTAGQHYVFLASLKEYLAVRAGHGSSISATLSVGATAPVRLQMVTVR
ncbi:MAG: hypothetical protein L3K18_03430 [Thermoplasmata archaeon]|nr:hypothetical protein [Thermoplasmata archaeon]MCI4356184.1 hypothetical protein [Thermoplasmata archaeon]